MSTDFEDREDNKLKLRDLQTGSLKIDDLRSAGPFRWTSASRTHPGRVRENNEDALAEQPEHGLWAVADGMGGHSMGEFASALAIESLKDLPASDDLEQRVRTVKARLLDVNRRLRLVAKQHDVAMVGTTIAVLLVCGRRCSCLWAGDSRIYLLRQGRLRRLTRDHNYLEAVRARNIASTEDTLMRPPTNLITRALGVQDGLEIDRIDLEPADGDVFLLCSDGLSNEVDDAGIGQSLMAGLCDLSCEALINKALEGPAGDNVTAVVVSAEDMSSADRTIIR